MNKNICKSAWVCGGIKKFVRISDDDLAGEISQQSKIRGSMPPRRV